MSTCRIQWATRTLTPNRISTNRLRSLHKALPQAQRTGRTHRTRIRMRPQITPATVPRTLGKGLTPLEVPCLPSNPVPATDSLHQNQTKRGKRARPTRPGPLLTGPGKHPAPILRVRGLLSLVARSTKKKKQELPLTQAGQDLVLLGAQRLRRPESLNNLVMLYGLVISHRARTWSISRTTLPAMPLMTLKVFF